jgi:hypothetical protein
MCTSPGAPGIEKGPSSGGHDDDNFAELPARLDPTQSLGKVLEAIDLADDGP